MNRLDAHEARPLRRGASEPPGLTSVVRCGLQAEEQAHIALHTPKSRIGDIAHVAHQRSYEIERRSSHLT